MFLFFFALYILFFFFICNKIYYFKYNNILSDKFSSYNKSKKIYGIIFYNIYIFVYTIVLLIIYTYIIVYKLLIYNNLYAILLNFDIIYYFIYVTMCGTNIIFLIYQYKCSHLYDYDYKFNLFFLLCVIFYIHFLYNYCIICFFFFILFLELINIFIKNELNKLDINKYKNYFLFKKNNKK
jgi:hypothetical protein